MKQSLHFSTAKVRNKWSFDSFPPVLTHCATTEMKLLS